MRFLTLVFSLLIVGILFFVLEEGEGVDLCFGGRRREMVEVGLSTGRVSQSLGLTRTRPDWVGSLKN